MGIFLGMIYQHIDGSEHQMKKEKGKKEKKIVYLYMDGFTNLSPSFPISRESKERGPEGHSIMGLDLTRQFDNDLTDLGPWLLILFQVPTLYYSLLAKSYLSP